MNERHFVYMVQCRDESLYTGWTTNLSKRLEVHNKGLGAKYTRSRLPVKLVYYECYPNKSTGLKREYAIKQLSRTNKMLLIENLKTSLLTDLI